MDEEEIVVQEARKRGVQVAYEWFNRNGSVDFPKTYLVELAAARGWCITPGDLRWHTYVQAAIDELDRLMCL